MQMNEVNRLTVAMYLICVLKIVTYTRGIPRKIRSHSYGITAKIIPITVVTTGFS